MFDDDTANHKKSAIIDLDILSIVELEERIITLNEEILRTKAVIDKKKSSMNAANALFGNHNE
ncbi:MAG: DUF1192 domain-containing protein [Caulobacterales bacterium]|nr:DUF1192 domain-containing protein [Caulobacterales bacterium]